MTPLVAAQGAEGLSQRPLRVLFCTTSYPPETRGGAERQARLQAEELVHRGHEVTVVCPSLRGASFATVNGIRVHRLPSARGRVAGTLLYGIALALYLCLNTFRYDLVHVHLAAFHVHFAAFFSLVFHRPLYLKLGAGGANVGDIAQMRDRAPLTRFYGIRRADRVQAISDEIAHELMVLGIPSSRVVRIPNGFDPARFYPLPAAREQIRAALGLPSEALIVLFTGRFSRHKGLEDLLAVWDEVAAGTKAVLVMAGAPAASGPLSAEALATRGVVVHGWTEQVEDYLRAADIFVLPSYSEGMSNSLLEAMACGLPVIASRVGAAEEMIESGTNGILVAARDREELSRSLRLLIEDAALRAAIAERAAQSVQRFSTTRVVDAIEDEYRALVMAQGVRKRRTSPVSQS